MELQRPINTESAAPRRPSVAETVRAIEAALEDSRLAGDAFGLALLADSEFASSTTEQRLAIVTTTGAQAMQRARQSTGLTLSIEVDAESLWSALTKAFTAAAAARVRKGARQ